MSIFADSLQLDQDACANLKSVIAPCYGHMGQLKGGHYDKILGITEDSGKCLLDEYEVRVSLFTLSACGSRLCTLCNQAWVSVLTAYFLFCARLHSVFVTHEVSFAIFLLIHQLNVCSEQVDEPTCSTPRRRQFNLPTIASIEELRTPAFEELLRLFWDMKSSKQANGDMKYVLGLNESAQSVRDSRLPLTAIN